MRSRRTWLMLALVLLLLPLPVAAGAGAQEPEPPGRALLSGPAEGAAEDIAVDFLLEEAAAYGVSEADLAELAVLSSATSEHNGVTHVNLIQRYQGLEVFGGHVTVNVMADGSILFVGSSLVPDLRVAGDADADLDAVDAVEAAADGLDLDAPVGLRVLTVAGEPSDETVLTTGGISDEPIQARQGWHVTAAGLRPAWQVVIDESEASHLWNATIDAVTGDVLAVEDWTVHDSATELAGLVRPETGRASLASSALQPGGVWGPVESANDGASYRVFEPPKESPNEMPRTLQVSPADALASPFGWHDTNGVDGPEYTITRGNNAHAYSDRDANNAVDPGSEPEGGPGLTFDFPADLNEHPQTYVEASLTNLFFWCNVTHDVLYRYGWTETSGNFQVNNYGRGGVGGDDVRCEGMDGSGQNNANFSTPAADGGQPRMQMFLWPGAQFGRPNAVTVGTGDGAPTYEAEYARFSPAPTTVGISGNLELANDGVGATGDGCTAYTVTTGAIAVVDRTNVCNYYVQTVNAQNAGASAVIVANNVASAPPVMAGSMSPAVTIPVVMVTQADGNALKAALPSTGSVHRNRNRPPMRDADFRAITVLHEYGHGWSLRLTGGPGTNCLSGDEQMGEGWSDYLAINVLLDPSLDDPQGVRGYGNYATFVDSRTGPGFRAAPYSRNMNINPFTYDMIRTGGWLNGTSLAVPHGIGSVWANVLWDMTWDLIDVHGFNPDTYADWSTGGNNLALQLVSDGLKMQGCAPGFVVGRAAIIAADVALTGGENHCTLWRTFARRGLGVSASQGGTGRNDNTQAFDIPFECVRNQSRVTLLGENEVGGTGDPDGSGDARISWDQSGKVCFDIRVRDIATPTAAHIHSGGHGVNGPVVIDFDIGANGLKGCVNGASQALLEDIRTNPTRYYVNVHNADHPGGAIRAQLS